MASFVLMQPPAGEKSDGPALPLFVRDGFSWLALVFGPLWLAWHRLWLPAITVLAVMMAITALGARLGLGTPAAMLSALVSTWVGLEGASMRIAGLRRRGYTDIGVVMADSLSDAELRFAAGVSEEGAAPRRAAPPSLRLPINKPLPHDPAIGFLTFPSKS
ncbi:MAG TPA: DUF2628 domain-containing protein [Mesorhizobium sp.]|jgi:Protein of unknown function (DUF2628)